MARVFLPKNIGHRGRSPRAIARLCRKSALILCLAIVAVQVASTSAQNAMPVPLRDVGIDQRLNEQVPLDLVFRDEAGREVRLSEYFADKPVILTLVYYECPMLCNEVLNGLLRSLRALPFDIGDQFAVITVSFNPRETSALAAAKRATYIERYRRPRAAQGWHFLTGQEESIEALARAVGFRYAYDAETGQYAHASGIMVLTPEGKVSRYFYGIEYAARDLRLGLVEASRNRIGTAIDQLLLFCYQYDPRIGKYSALVMNMLRLAGLLTALGLATLILVLRRRERDEK